MRIEELKVSSESERTTNYAVSITRIEFYIIRQLILTHKMLDRVDTIRSTSSNQILEQHVKLTVVFFESLVKTIKNPKVMDAFDNMKNPSGKIKIPIMTVKRSLKEVEILNSLIKLFMEPVGTVKEVVHSSNQKVLEFKLS